MANVEGTIQIEPRVHMSLKTRSVRTEKIARLQTESLDESKCIKSNNQEDCKIVTCKIVGSKKIATFKMIVSSKKIKMTLLPLVLEPKWILRRAPCHLSSS